MAIGMACYFHQQQQAVAQCGDCGKALCKNCYDSYGGAVAGKALCYHCTANLVKQHSSEIADIKAWATGEIGFFASVSNLAINLADGFGLDYYLVLLLVLVASIFIAPVAIPILVVYHMWRSKRFKSKIESADLLLENDERILQELRDYFEYTQVMEQNQGVDLATLAAQESKLFNNTYVKTALSQGEQAAQAQLGKGAAQIAANGEIIRGFKKDKNEAA